VGYRRIAWPEQESGGWQSIFDALEARGTSAVSGIRLRSCLKGGVTGSAMSLAGPRGGLREGQPLESGPAGERRMGIDTMCAVARVVD